MSRPFGTEDYWRSIILYGMNTATYKIALAKALYDLTKQGKDKVTMTELADVFFQLYKLRLQNNMPQLGTPARQTKMEFIVNRFNLGLVDEAQAIDYVEKNAFVDVIPRFHTVNNQKIPMDFYEYSNEGLILKDDIFLLFETNAEFSLIEEVNSRWDLIEAAFQQKRSNEKLANDVRRIYLVTGYERKNITNLIPVLNGYQKGICFYCGESLEGHKIHVDHVMPRQVIYHDEIWNLVLAHEFCNEQKSDSLPSVKYIHKLIDRNEHFIASNHPIKNDLIQTLGNTAELRKKYILHIYEDVKKVIPYTWEGIKGYNPETDEFYKSFIKSIMKKQIIK
jgi:5-methylcytosine-specific restriction endonuclease McrA